MAFITLSDVTLHYRYRDGVGVPVVFLNSLGTDMRIWDEVAALMPAEAPVLFLDKRGHGLSDAAEITMPLLIADVAAVMDRLEIGAALVCGVSVGGLIAQGLAVERPDLVAGLVLCCTGAKIGDADGWTARIETVTTEGIAPMADAILDRWFSATFRSDRAADLAGYRNMLTRTPAQGYAGVCGAIRDTDFTGQSARISVPTHCISGMQDLATPPALVQTLAEIISGATYEQLDTCAHLPSIEQPDATARAILRMYEALT